MATITLKNGQTSIILRVKIYDTTSLIGGGKTGLAYNSAGLIVATMADSEASATVYTQAGSTIETITTLGTFAAPTASKCRFKEVDATNFPGLYEIQIANARWAVSGARYVDISLPPVSGLGTAPVLVRVQLTAVDPQDAVRFGLSALPNAAAEAAGGLYTRGIGAGQINQDANGRADANVKAIAGSASAATNQGGAAAAIVTGAAATGTLTTTQLTTNLTETNADQYVGRVIIFTSGTLVNQAADITGYTPTGGKLTVSELTDAPSNGNTFVIV